jgi:hypothetical protein
VDWQRLESMLQSYGLDNLASEARQHGQSSDLEQRISASQLAAQQRRVQELLRRAKAAQADARPKPADRPASRDRRGPPAVVRWSQLPGAVQQFIDAVVRQGEPGQLYTMEEQTSAGIPYECSASFYEDNDAGPAQRHVFLLLESQQRTGKSSLTYRRRGSTWTRREE